jgi:hypothetical protein
MWRTTGAAHFDKYARQEPLASWSRQRAWGLWLYVNSGVVVSSHHRP